MPGRSLGMRETRSGSWSTSQFFPRDPAIKAALFAAGLVPHDILKEQQGRRAIHLQATPIAETMRGHEQRQQHRPADRKELLFTRQITDDRPGLPQENNRNPPAMH